MASWRTIRVFVSGTFADFQAEREILQRRVFPELRSRCHARRLHLLDIDLRWGVPPATSEAKICELCLDNVRRADILVVLLGARYGWQPEAAVRPPKTPGDAGSSITELEVETARACGIPVLGVLRDGTLLSERSVRQALGRRRDARD